MYAKRNALECILHYIFPIEDTNRARLIMADQHSNKLQTLFD